MRWEGGSSAGYEIAVRWWQLLVSSASLVSTTATLDYTGKFHFQPIPPPSLPYYPHAYPPQDANIHGGYS